MVSKCLVGKSHPPIPSRFSVCVTLILFFFQRDHRVTTSALPRTSPLVSPPCRHGDPPHHPRAARDEWTTSSRRSSYTTRWRLPNKQHIQQHSQQRETLNLSTLFLANKARLSSWVCLKALEKRNIILKRPLKNSQKIKNHSKKTNLREIPQNHQKK